MNSLIFGLISGLIGLAVSAYFSYEVIKFSTDDEIKKIGNFIRKGAFAYLKREYSIVTPFIIIVALLLLFLFSWKFSLPFLIGSALSILSGFIGMYIATIANQKTTYAAKKSINSAVYTSLTGGAVMGVITSSFGILGMCIVYILSKKFLPSAPQNIIVAYSLGASCVALFARVGGGIYTKGADIGADIVGKTEARIPEDDPRNPAVIADNVGDNVGDVAGMGADLYESYIGAIYGSIALALISKNSSLYIDFIFYAIGSGLISSLIVIILGRYFALHSKLNPGKFIKNIGPFSSILTIAILLIICVASKTGYNIFFSAVSGIICGVIIGIITDYYTSKSPVKDIAKKSISGTAPNILKGLSVGMESTFLTIVLIGIATLLSYSLSGIFGIGIAGVGMLLTLSATVSVDAYGPIADNAGGIAQMSAQPSYVRERTDLLDSIGNTTAAIGKGFSIGSAALTALTLFNTFASISNVNDLSLLNPNIIVGLMIGGMLPFLFSALIINSTSNTADLMVNEVRRQFREKVGILKGLTLPDYEKCIDISTTGALKGMIIPSILGIVSPFIVYVILGFSGVAGLLAGALVSGVLLAIFMANSGGAWDNAKKLIETGKYGGKGSVAHIAAVTGDTVGDPLKDAAGPSLNILIKLLSIVSLTFMPLFL